MILPTTFVSALILLLLSFFCLGSWINTFKLAGTRWRFELFYIDFAFAALVFCVIAAFTVGTMGSDVAFSDRMLVAGRGAQVFVIAAGFVFNLGNMLLISAVSLIGMAAAFPLSIGIALIVSSLFNFRSDNIFFLLAGIVLLIIAVILDGAACLSREAARLKIAPAPKAAAGTPRAPVKPARLPRKGRKGLIVGVIGGILLGLFYPVTAKEIPGDFGLGPYAGVLLFAIGVLLSTIMFNFYFLNIAIEGGPLTFGAYFKGKPRQHLLGFAGGALWAAGTLCAALVDFTPQKNGLPPSLGLILPFASVLLVVLWGAFGWKEFASAPAGAKTSIAVTAVLFAAGLVLVSFGFVI